MPLKSETVDAIFARMLARYGSTWLAKWQGVPMDAVKADWAMELEGASKESILYALRYLPLEFPPTSSQFRVLCTKAPEPEQPLALTPPRDPVKTAELSTAAKRATAADKAIDPKEWAIRMQTRDMGGEKITVTMRAMYRAALGLDRVAA